MDIVIAVTNYKNLESLIYLIRQLTEQHFGMIYVFDDCSPNIKEISAQLSSFNNVKIIPSKKRLLPTLNRNRIMHENMGEVVLFLDSDLQFISGNIIKEIEANFRDKSVAIVGGLILENNKTMNQGYGIGGFFPLDQSWLFSWFRPLSRQISKITSRRIIRETTEVKWVAEGVMAVRSETFCELSGFDGKFELYHEGPDLCLRARAKGYKVLYNPRIKFNHLSLEHIKKRKNINRSSAYWFYKHNHWPKWLLNILFPHGENDVINEETTELT